jgi:hypothetical protein
MLTQRCSIHWQHGVTPSPPRRGLATDTAATSWQYGCFVGTHGQWDGVDNTMYDQRNALHDLRRNIANTLQCRAMLNLLVDTPELISHIFDTVHRYARIITKAIYSNVELNARIKLRVVVSNTASPSLTLGTVQIMQILQPYTFLYFVSLNRPM